ncbi:hypothetical protein RHGRI_031466 [Rhododendron griersonianum]|uniref:Uncharacterized protein n=1 Tax=Rhododendron griersonianum TaxID=479676 RepID=A0AAV6IDS6_9ERIC|nr:hypothetical protein RHGRI_031466 [Rhododendron griersonianum]
MEQRRPRPQSPLRLEFAFLPPSDKSTILAELLPSPLRREFLFFYGRIKKVVKGRDAKIVHKTKHNLQWHALKMTKCLKLASKNDECLKLASKNEEFVVA